MTRTDNDLVVAPQVLAGMLSVEAPTDVTLLDVRWVLGRADGHEQYLAGHVPGASYVDMEADLADPVGDGTRGRHPLPDPDRFAAAMRRCGVRRDRPVVVYDDSAGTAAARAWWLLTYHGHPDVRVLDRGWSAYVDAGGPVETGEAETEPGDFTADPGHLPVVDADDAARLAREGVLIDVRAAERYRGEVEPIDPVAGHVPGAVNVPFMEANLFKGDNMHAGFRVLDDTSLFYARAGVGVTREVGVYCGSGVTAAHSVLTLRRLGVAAALYPGSWSEWVSDPARPVETGDAGQ
jgi:thiosulfate/3-mercaptopyruvate sulfurtransferase